MPWIMAAKHLRFGPACLSRGNNIILGVLRFIQMQIL